MSRSSIAHSRHPRADSFMSEYLMFHALEGVGELLFYIFFVWMEFIVICQEEGFCWKLLLDFGVTVLWTAVLIVPAFFLLVFFIANV